VSHCCSQNLDQSDEFQFEQQEDSINRLIQYIQQSDQAKYNKNQLAYQRIVEGKKKILTVPLGNGVNRYNSFDQSYDDLDKKLSKMEGAFYVDKHVFKGNGSLFKGEMRKTTKGRYPKKSDRELEEGSDTSSLFSLNPQAADSNQVVKKEVSERHGYGINKWTSGAVYEGEWRKNKTHGLGTFWHSSGDIYTGEFLDDKANGFGVYTHLNSSVY